jgi:hypothetical protein
MASRKGQDSFQVRDDTPGMCRARTALLRVARLAVHLITSEYAVIQAQLSRRRKPAAKEVTATRSRIHSRVEAADETGLLIFPPELAMRASPVADVQF